MGSFLENFYTILFLHLEIGLELKSNKRNIVSKIFDQLNYKVLRLDLVFFGGLTKKDIPRKKSRFLTESEINLLKRL